MPADAYRQENPSDPGRLSKGFPPSAASRTIIVVRRIRLRDLPTVPVQVRN